MASQLPSWNKNESTNQDKDSMGGTRVKQGNWQHFEVSERRANEGTPIELGNYDHYMQTMAHHIMGVQAGWCQLAAGASDWTPYVYVPAALPTPLVPPVAPSGQCLQLSGAFWSTQVNWSTCWFELSSLNVSTCTRQTPPAGGVCGLRHGQNAANFTWGNMHHQRHLLDLSAPPLEHHWHRSASPRTAFESATPPVGKATIFDI